MSTLPRECRSLYARYKNACEQIDWDLPLLKIDTGNFDISQLSVHMNNLLSVYNQLSSCLTGRLEHRKSCVREEEYDIGHNYQLERLESTMITISNEINNTFLRIEEIAQEDSPISSDETTPFDEAVPVRKQSQRQRRAQPSLETQLRSIGIDVKRVDRDVAQERSLLALYPNIVRDVKKSNPARLLRRAHTNPLVWRIAIPLAIEHRADDILSTAISHIRYLSSQGNTSLNPLLETIDSYALQHNLDMYMQLHRDVEFIVIGDTIDVHPLVYTVLRTASNENKVLFLNRIIEDLSRTYRYITNDRIFDTIVSLTRYISRTVGFPAVSPETLLSFFEHVLTAPILEEKLRIGVTPHYSAPVLYALVLSYVLRLTSSSYLKTLTKEQIQNELQVIDRIPQTMSRSMNPYRNLILQTSLSLARNLLTDAL